MDRHEAGRVRRDWLEGRMLDELKNYVLQYEAARILGLRLTDARQAGYDAIEERDGKKYRLQIKGRCILPNCKPGQRMGSINVEKEFDSVLLVLLDENFEATEIYEADRTAVLGALAVPGSKARNERGTLPISKFRAIGQLRWRRILRTRLSDKTPENPSVTPQTRSGVF
jgi:hypothetical protein